MFGGPALTPEQQQAMLNWQWQQYYEQYAQWQAQYGQQYQMEMNRLQAASSVAQLPVAVAQPPLPTQPPPPPPPSNADTGNVAQPPPPPPPPEAQEPESGPHMGNKAATHGSNSDSGMPPFLGNQNNKNFNHRPNFQNRPPFGAGGGGHQNHHRSQMHQPQQSFHHHQHQPQQQQQQNHPRFDNNRNSNPQNNNNNNNNNNNYGHNSARRGNMRGGFNNNRNRNNRNNYQQQQGNQNNWWNNNNNNNFNNGPPPVGFNENDGPGNNYHQGMNSSQMRYPQQRQPQCPPLNTNSVPDQQNDEDEKIFDEQFKKWENDFNNWKMQNQNNPDRKFCLEYEQKFEEVRQKLLDRRDQMRKRKMETNVDNINPNNTNNCTLEKAEPPSITPTAEGQEASGDKVNDENADSLFSGKPTNSGIPGLDLVVKDSDELEAEEEGENNDDNVTEVIDLADDDQEDNVELTGDGPTEPPKKARYVEPTVEEILNFQKPPAFTQPPPPAATSQDEQKPHNFKPNPQSQLSSVDINDLLQNPNILNLLSQVKGTANSMEPNQQPQPTICNPLSQPPPQHQRMDMFGSVQHRPPIRIWDKPPDFQRFQSPHINRPPPSMFPRPYGMQCGRPDQQMQGDSSRWSNMQNMNNLMMMGGNQPRPITNINYDPEFRPTQVIDYQNQSTKREPEPLLPAKVVDYGHKSVNSSGESGFSVDYKSDSQMDCQRRPRGGDDRWRDNRSGAWETDRNNKKGSWDDNRKTTTGFQRNDGQERRTRFSGGTSTRFSKTGGDNISSKADGPKVEDYLEGISDDEIGDTANEGDDDGGIDGADDMSLSSVEDVPSPTMASTATDIKSILPPLETNPMLLSVEDLLLNPGRKSRPSKILVVIRGLPGSGKTHVAKLLKDKEVEMGGSPPRILSIDDYFTTEADDDEDGGGGGKSAVVVPGGASKEGGVPAKAMVYKYEADMEERYMQYLAKALRKTVTDGYFDFIIVDAVYEKMANVLEITTFARSNGFEPYICEMKNDVQQCLDRNIHNRTEAELNKLTASWEACPKTELQLDIEPLLKMFEIPEIAMEDISNDELDAEEEQKSTSSLSLSDAEENGSGEEKKDDGNESDGQDGECVTTFKSKWDNPSEDRLAKLDGTSKPLRTPTLEEFLQLDETDERDRELKPGEKRVRWADIEEKRAQEKMRAIGFVVGQTDWNRMMDPTEGQSALTKTKYIERVKKGDAE